MKEILVVLKKLPATFQLDPKKVTLDQVIICLLNDATGKEIVQAAEAITCHYLLVEITATYYEKIEPDDLARLLCRISSMEGTESEKTWPSGYAYTERVFKRKTDSPEIKNPIFKKAMESDYFKNNNNIYTALLQSKYRLFSEELLCSNMLTMEQFAPIVDRYLETMKNPDKKYFSLLYQIIDRYDCFPAHELSLDVFSLEHLEQIIDCEYAGYDFLHTALDIIATKKEDSLLLIIKKEVYEKSASEGNERTLNYLLSQNRLLPEEILAVAQKYKDGVKSSLSCNYGYWVLKACSEAKNYEQLSPEDKADIARWLGAAGKRQFPQPRENFSH